MRTLIIQIPCYNEEDMLPVTLAALPASVPGFDAVEVLVIDDGSTDKTLEIARKMAVTHILSLGHHKGLAQAYMHGLRFAREKNASAVVNVDADNQYCADDIALLTAPIIAGAAQCVIGERPIEQIAHFSWQKKMLIRVGSWCISRLAGINIMDAPSGFRAIHRDAIAALDIRSRYTYTLEMLICLAAKKVPIQTVNIRINQGIGRPSRLIRSNTEYLLQGLKAIIFSVARYQPVRFSISLAIIALLTYGAFDAAR